MKLTHKDRWILSNQYRILEELYPDQAESFEYCREIVENGYEYEYENITQLIYPPMSVEECQNVWDILEMYEYLQQGYDSLDGNEKKEIGEEKIVFRGFDANNQSEQFAYVHFIINKKERYNHLRRNGSLNSLNPRSLTLYRSMLNEWSKSADKKNLSEEDILRIVSIS